MIGIYGIQIEDLPCGDTLKSALRANLLQPWALRHGTVKGDSYLRASLGGLWLLQQSGFMGGVSYDPKGRPISLDPVWDFNITHTDDWVFCAVERCEAPSLRPPRVGLDAEAFGRFDDARRMALVKRWCAEGERKLYAADPTDVAFTRLWTQKEAYVKYSGEGLCGLRQSDVTSLTELRFFTYQIEGTVLTLCAHVDAQVPTNVTIFQFS